MLAQRVMNFLHRLVKRNAPTSTSFNDAMDLAVKTGKLDTAKFSKAYYKTENANMFAAVLSTFGADPGEELVDRLTAACAACISQAKDKEQEVIDQLSDLLHCMSEESPTGYNHDALCESFKGREYKLLSDGGVQFSGCDAYPATLNDGSQLWRLVSASYKKGIYQKV